MQGARASKARERQAAHQLVQLGQRRAAHPIEPERLQQPRAARLVRRRPPRLLAAPSSAAAASSPPTSGLRLARAAAIVAAAIAAAAAAAAALLRRPLGVRLGVHLLGWWQRVQPAPAPRGLEGVAQQLARHRAHRRGRSEQLPLRRVEQRALPAAARLPDLARQLEHAAERVAAHGRRALLQPRRAHQPRVDPPGVVQRGAQLVPPRARVDVVPEPVDVRRKEAAVRREHRRRRRPHWAEAERWGGGVARGRAGGR